MNLRNVQTNEVAPAHQIGTAKNGLEIYQFVSGWLPTFAHFTDEDGNFVALTETERIVNEAAESYVNEFGNDKLDSEWSETSYNDIPSSEAKFITWAEYHELLEERIDAIA